DDEGDDEGGGRGGRCGSDPNDADQLASVRATAAAQCDCASASGHGSYVSCVRDAVDAAVGSGSLRAACRDDVTKCASKSTCGREGSVTCCRTDKHGKTKCDIKHRADDCKAPHGGTACVGQVSSCCDACGADGTDRKSTRLNSSHVSISYAVFCLKKKILSHNRNQCFGDVPTTGVNATGIDSAAQCIWPGHAGLQHWTGRGDFLQELELRDRAQPL